MKRALNESEIFNLLRSTHDGDSQAKQHVTSMADLFFEWDAGDRLLIIFNQSTVHNVQECFLSTRNSNTTFYIPASFVVKNIDFKDNVYSFQSVDGRLQPATLRQLSDMWDVLPLGGNRISERHVEQAFSNCTNVRDTEHVSDSTLGTLQYVHGTYGVDQVTIEAYTFALFVHCNNATTVRSCMERIGTMLTKLSTYDVVARKSLTEKLLMTEDDLSKINIDNIDYYIGDEFDLTYVLPEGYNLEYVRVCFSKAGIPTETTFGNF